MNKLPILLLLLSGVQICHSMKVENLESNVSDLHYVQIPSAKVLQNRFNEMILDHFYSKADNIKNLAGKEAHIIFILGEINKAIRKYAKHADQSTAIFIQELKNEILEILLADFPDQLKLLQAIMIRIQKKR